MRVVVLLLTAALLSGCDEGSIRIHGASCKSDYQCDLEGVHGTCQPTGFCSYPDEACVDGFRYSPGATGMENTCVGGDKCGRAEDACCAQNVCGSDLVCVDGTCLCGAANEPCCDGSACNEGATCVAGTCTAGFDQLAIGRNFICGLRTDKVVECWGRDGFPYSRNVPGQQIPVLLSLQPVVIANATNVAELRAGEGHACIRKTDGTLWCWGQNRHGQLGNGTTVGSLAAVQVTGLSAVTQFSVGRQHTCAVGTVSGTPGMYCWGHNGIRNVQNEGTAGRLGNGSTADSAVPVPVDMSQMASAGQTVRAIAAGGYHTCAVMSDNVAWCWGKGEYGVLGNNTTTDALSPVPVDLSQITIPSGVTIDEIVTGTGYRDRNTACMRLSDGTSYCWGASPAYGDGTTANIQRPRPETAVTTTALGAAHFVKLSALAEAICGLDSAGKVWCWGDRKHGQLGTTGVGSQGLPAEVVGLPATVTALATGHRNGCALDATKRAWCWGNNRRGILTGSLPDTDAESVVATPVEVKP